MGPPGAGKGTQAGGIAEHYKVPAISTGQLFRDNIALGTALGRTIEGLIAAGIAVSCWTATRGPLNRPPRWMQNCSGCGCALTA